MSEKLSLYIQSSSSYDEVAENAITYINLHNFDQASDSSGNFSAPYPRINIGFNSSLSAIPTGYTFTFGLGSGCYVTRAVETVYSTDTGSPHTWTFVPTSPMMSDTWEESGAIHEIVLIIYSVSQGNMPVSFDGFHMGANAIDLGKAARSCTITSSCDLSGMSAAYATLAATVMPGSLKSYLTVKTHLRCKSMSSNLPCKDFGSYWIKSVTSTGNYNANSDNVVGITAVSYLGILADETFGGWYGSGSSIGTSNISDIIDLLVGEDYDIDITPWDNATKGRKYNDYWFVEAGIDKRTALARLGMRGGFWIDQDCQFRDIDTAIAVSVPSTLVYQYPTLSTIETVKTLTYKAYQGRSGDGSYVWSRTLEDGTQVQTSSNKTIETNVQQVYLYYWDDVSYTRVSGSKTVAIDNECVPDYYNNLTLRNTVIAAQKNYWARGEVWNGKVLWEGGFNVIDIRCGKHVMVPTPDGNTMTGHVISCKINFSGASVAAEIQVLKDGTW